MSIISTACPLSAKYICIMRTIIYSEMSMGTHNVNVKFIYVCKRERERNLTYTLTVNPHACSVRIYALCTLSQKYVGNFYHDEKVPVIKLNYPGLYTDI